MIQTTDTGSAALLNQAERHLNSFRTARRRSRLTQPLQFLGLTTRRYDLTVGAHAYLALRAALKGLLTARGFGDRKDVREQIDIDNLVREAEYRIPELNDFELGIHPHIYTEYHDYAEDGDRNPFRLAPRRTTQQDRFNRTVRDIEFILTQARTPQEPEETP